MGVITRTIKDATCDICMAECGEYDGDIEVRVNNGDGKDVGPAYITGTLRFYQPYGVSSGILCRACKLKFLTRYLNELRRQAEEASNDQGR
jgi:hypothetical protein